MNETPSHCASDPWARRALWVAITTCLSLSSGPVDAAAPGETTSRPFPTPQLFESGARLYAKQCAVCHGAFGRGDGAASYLLYPKPRDFTRDEYRLVSTDDMTATDQDLFQTLTRGMPGSSMPSWEGLTDEQRWALVYYVRYLEEVGEQLETGELTQAEVNEGLAWEQVESLITMHADAASMEVPVEPRVTAVALERGKAIYAQACAACHGPQGAGDGRIAMEDSQGVPVRPRDLTAGILKGSSESRDLYYRIIAGLPGSPMPSYAGAYSDEEIWALVHYVQSLLPEGVEDRARMRPRTVHARRIDGDIPQDPYAQVWESVDPVAVALSPLWWRDERIAAVEIQAVHNGKRIAIRISWIDASADVSAVKTEEFSDGAAIQLSGESDPPFFGMGGTHGEVVIWHWKASRQRDLAGHGDVEDAYPDMMVEYYPNQENWELGTHQENVERGIVHHDPELVTGWGAGNPMSDPKQRMAAESLRAKGQGTLTSRPTPDQAVEASGRRGDGRWTVVFSRDLAGTGPDDVTLRPDEAVSMAAAVWDGAAKDRDGQKSFSIWQRLTLER